MFATIDQVLTFVFGLAHDKPLYIVSTPLGYSILSSVNDGGYSFYPPYFLEVIIPAYP